MNWCLQVSLLLCAREHQTLAMPQIVRSKSEYILSESKHIYRLSNEKAQLVRTQLGRRVNRIPHLPLSARAGFQGNDSFASYSDPRAKSRMGIALRKGS